MPIIAHEVGAVLGHSEEKNRALEELVNNIVITHKTELDPSELSAKRERYLDLYEGMEPSLSIYRNHASNVAELALILAGDLSFPEDEIESLSKVSLLHDVGNNNEDRKLRNEITAFSRRHNISTTFVGLRKQLKDEGMTITLELEDALDKVLEDRLRQAGLEITTSVKRHLSLILYHERCAIEIIKVANVKLSTLEELLIRYHSYPSELTAEHFGKLFLGRFDQRERDSLITRARRLLSVLVAADTIEAASSHDRSIHIPDYHRTVESLEGLFSSLDRKYARGDIDRETYEIANSVILSQDREFLRVIKRARHLDVNEPLPDFDAEAITHRVALLDLVAKHAIVSKDGLLQDTRGRTLNKGEIDFLVNYLSHGRTLAEAGRSLFSEIDKVALRKGYEKLPAQSRYAFQKLLAIGGKELVDEASSLTETARRELRTLFAYGGEITFADISENILYGLIEEKEGFTGFTDITPFPSMPKVLFIGPGRFPMGESDAAIRSRRLYPHSYRTASFLEQHGISVDIYDVNLDGSKELERIIGKRQYDFISLSPSNPVTEVDLELAKLVSRTCADAIIVLGGEGAAFDYDRFLEVHQIPAVVIRGYGSKFMLNMVVSYKEKHPAEQMKFYLHNLFCRIPNLYLLDADGKAISTRLISQFTQKYLRVVSRVINYTKVPYERYWDADLDRRPSVDFLMTEEERLFYRDTVRITTKSHCPYRCAFCGYTQFLVSSISGEIQPVLTLPADDIYIMIRKILDLYPRFRKNGLIYFHDDDFISPEAERMLEAFEAGYGLGEDIVYFGFTRIDKVNEELLKKLRRAGFRKLLYGIETFSDRLLEVMNKHYAGASPAELAKQVVRSTLRAGIIPVITLILFYPYADLEDIKVTIDETVELTAEGAIPNVYPYVEARAGASLTKEARTGKLEIVGRHVVPVDSELRRMAKQSILEREEVREQAREKYVWRHEFSPALETMRFFKSIYQTAGISTDRIDEVMDALVNRYRNELVRNLLSWMEKSEQRATYSLAAVISELERLVPDYIGRIDSYLSDYPKAVDGISELKRRIMYD